MAERRNRIGEAVARSRPADPPRREVAAALFDEHLDLATIRKALGQPLAAPRPAPEDGPVATPSCPEPALLAEPPRVRPMFVVEQPLAAPRSIVREDAALADERTERAAPRRRRPLLAVAAAAAVVVALIGPVTSRIGEVPPQPTPPDAITTPAGIVVASGQDLPLRAPSPGAEGGMPTWPEPQVLPPVAAEPGLTLAAVAAVPLAARIAMPEPPARPEAAPLRLPSADAGPDAETWPPPPDPQALSLVVAEPRLAGAVTAPARLAALVAAPAPTAQSAGTPAAAEPRVVAAARTPAAPRLGVPRREALDHRIAIALLMPAGLAPPTAAAPTVPRPRPADLAVPIRVDPAPAMPPPSSSPRVVIHYNPNAGAVARAPIVAALRAAGFGRIEWRAVPLAISTTNVRFFHGADRDLSRRVAGAMTATNTRAVERDFTFFEPPASPGTIEVWLAR